MSQTPNHIALHKYTSAFVSKVERLSKSRLGLFTLAFISFFESFLPLPLLTDPFLVTAVLFNREKAVRLVLITTTSSVLGGLLAYYTAYFAFDYLSGNLSPSLLNDFNRLVENNDSNTLVLTLIGAVTPVPYTIVAWVAGALSANPLVFIFGSILGRGFRYSVVAFCAYKFGPLAGQYAKKYILLTSLILFILIGIFLFLKIHVL